MKFIVLYNLYQIMKPHAIFIVTFKQLTSNSEGWKQNQKTRKIWS